MCAIASARDDAGEHFQLIRAQSAHSTQAGRKPTYKPHAPDMIQRAALAMSQTLLRARAAPSRITGSTRAYSSYHPRTRSIQIGLVRPPPPQPTPSATEAAEPVQRFYPSRRIDHSSPPASHLRSISTGRPRPYNPVRRAITILQFMTIPFIPFVFWLKDREEKLKEMGLSKPGGKLVSEGGTEKDHEFRGHASRISRGVR